MNALAATLLLTTQGADRLALGREVEALVVPGAPMVFELEAPIAGILFVWAMSDAGDPILALERDGMERIEDDDGGGGTTAFLRVLVESPGTYRLEVAADSEASVAVHAALRSAVDENVRADARLMLEDGRALEASDADGARALYAAALEHLLTEPEVRRDDVFAELSTQIGLSADLAGANATALGGFGAASETYRALLPPTHEARRSCQADYGVALAEAGRYEEALAIQHEVVTVSERLLPADHQLLVIARNGLANSLRETGRFAEALELQLTMLDALEGSRPPGDHETLIVRLNTALTHVELGDLLPARRMLEEGVERLGATQPDGSIDLALARMNLAVVLFMLDDVDGALLVHDQAMEGLTEGLPPDHPYVRNGRDALASLLMHVGDAESAIAIQDELIERYTREVGPEHAWTLRARQNRAAALHALELHAEAARELDEVIAVYERAHPGLATTTLARLAHADALFRSGEASRARTELEIVVADERFPVSSPVQINARGRLVLTSLLDADPERAAGVARELADALETRLESAALTAAPREAEAAAAAALAPLGAVLARAGETQLVAPERAVELVETARGLGLAAYRVARRADDRTGDVERLRAKVRSAALEVNSLALGGAEPGDFTAAVTRLEASERALRDALGAEEVRYEVRTEHIARALAPDETGVTYWRYLVRTDGARPVDELHWVAFVVHPGGTVARVELGPAVEVERAIAAWRATLDPVSVDLRGVGAEGSNRSSDVPAGQLVYERIAAPLRAELGSARRLFVSLTPELERIPLDALPLDDRGERRLGDELVISIVDSLGTLTRGASPSNHDTLLALGGIEYAPNGYVALPAARAEVERIETLHAAAFPGAERRVLSGADATVEAFTRSAPAARWLHAATHGWFASESIPSVTSERVIDAELGLTQVVDLRESVRGLSPTLLCGLAFAGASEERASGERPSGVLTGADLARLDLEGCELAVLSACESGLGEMREVSGLASLRRALHAAGVENVIASSWMVPDEPTAELMSEFYRLVWSEQLPLAEALWEAKRRLREQGRSVSEWGAWSLSGGARRRPR